MVLRLALEFDAVTRGKTFSVQIQLEDDRGYLQGFDQLGVVTITRSTTALSEQFPLRLMLGSRE